MMRSGRRQQHTIVRARLVVLLATAATFSPCSSTPSSRPLKCLLCDIDGSLVHYEDELRKHGVLSEATTPGGTRLYTSSARGSGGSAGPAATSELIALPPSSTGLQAFISTATLDIAAAINVPIAIISGGRWTTVQRRVPYLPRAQAVVSDNGGRIFWRAREVELSEDGRGGGTDEAAAGDVEAAIVGTMVEDEAWRAGLVAASGGAIGGMEEDALPPEERSGALWDLYRRLIAEGWACDPKGYTTSFRIKFGGESAEEQEAEAQRLWRTTAPFNVANGSGGLGAGGLAALGLDCSVNLGAVDVYPAGSGKKAAGLFVARALGARPEQTAFLCDDDNDVDLATSVGLAVVPQCTSRSMAEAAAAHGDTVRVAPTGGCFGTEACLRRVLEATQLAK